MAENYPLISTALNGPYLSPYIRDELQAAEREGWDWTIRHEDLRTGAASD